MKCVSCDDDLRQMETYQCTRCIDEDKAEDKFNEKIEREEQLRSLEEDVTRATKRAERNPNKVNLAFLQRALADRRRLLPR
jgi:hypothetical protein